MKKIYITLFSLLSGMLLLMAGCSDNSGLTINQAALDGTLTFNLNTPSGASGTYVLLSDSADNSFTTLTCDQPAYGFKAAVTYTIQVSFSSDFSKHDSLPSTINGESIPLNVGEFNRAVARLYNGNMTNPTVATDIYVRLRANVSSILNSDSTLKVKPAYSNAIKLNIHPYFVLLKDADPAFYYMIGGAIGDGAWNNVASALGTSVIPMFVVPGSSYDATTGVGPFQYTAYFSANSSFKMIGTLGSWNTQVGSSDGTASGALFNVGTAGNFSFTDAGFYTVTLNTSTSTVTTAKYSTQSPTEYTSIELIGAFNSWADAGTVQLTKVAGTNSHIWTGSITLTSAGDLKFRANKSWDVAWGGSSFPYCLSTGSGNIPATIGTYTVFFNDLDGTYMFIKQTV